MEFIENELHKSMHTCGQDYHMAMLLGAAKILTEIKDELDGDVKLLFPPADEPAVGTKGCVEQGCMDDVGAFVRETAMYAQVAVDFLADKETE